MQRPTHGEASWYALLSPALRVAVGVVDLRPIAGDWRLGTGDSGWIGSVGWWVEAEPVAGRVGVDAVATTVDDHVVMMPTKQNQVLRIMVAAG
jgi:hypothetical protein